MEKIYCLVAATEPDLNKEIVTALREEQNEKNQYGSQYDKLYNADKMLECVGEQPIEDDIIKDKFDLNEENCTEDELVEKSVGKNIHAIES